MARNAVEPTDERDLHGKCWREKHQEREVEEQEGPAELEPAAEGPPAQRLEVAFPQVRQLLDGEGKPLCNLHEARGLRVVDSATFLADSGHHRILQLKEGTARVLVAGEGVEDAEDVYHPFDMLPLGDVLLIVDTVRSRILGCSGLASGTLSEPVVLLQPGGKRGKSSLEGLKFPRCIAATEEHVYIVDTWSHRIVRTVRPDFASLTAAAEEMAASVETVFGGGMPGAGLDQLSFPSHLHLCADGGWLVSDTNNHRVLRVKSGSAEVVCGSGQPGRGAEQLAGPAGLVVVNEVLYVADKDNGRIQRFAPGEKAGTTLCLAPAPWGLAVEGSKLLITDLLTDGLLTFDL